VSTEEPGSCPASDKGFAGTQRRDAGDVSPRKVNINAYCSLRSPNPTDIRGASNAPRAEGLEPFPNDASGGNSRTVKGAGLIGMPGWSTALADYDPRTGRAITDTGQRYEIGSTMGVSSLFGAGTWQWLLMDPLRRS
jgi:hypothetical protein